MKKIILFCISFCFLFASCQNFVDPIGQKNEALKDTIIIFTDTNEHTSRLALPISGYDKQKVTSVLLQGYIQNSSSEIYELQFSRNYSSINQLLSDSIPVESGNWQFKLTATQDGLPELTATVFQEIISNQTNSVYFQLKPYTNNNCIYNAYVPTSMDVILLSAMIYDGSKFIQSTTTDIKKEVISSGEYNNYTKYSVEYNLEPGTFLLYLYFYNSDYTMAGYYFDTIVIEENNLTKADQIITALEAKSNYATVTLKYPVDPEADTITWTNKTVTVVDGKKYTFPSTSSIVGYVVDSWYRESDYSGDQLNNAVISKSDSNIFYAKCVPVGLSGITFNSDYILDKSFETDVLHYIIFEKDYSSENTISLIPELLNSEKSELISTSYSLEKTDGNSIEIKVISKINSNICRTYTFTYSKQNTVAYYAATIPEYASGEYQIKPMYDATEEEYIRLINAIHNNSSIMVDLDLSKVLGIEKIPCISTTYPEITNIRSINLPQSTKNIDNMAFYKWTGLCSFSMPDTVEKLGYSLFTSDENLRGNFYVSKNLTDIASSALQGAHFDTLEVSSENLNYSGKNGLLLSKDESNAIALVGQKQFEQNNYRIPNTVKKIGNSCFGYTQIEVINIPSSVEVIDSLAFMYCKNLKQVVLPYSVSEIGSSCFNNCTELEYVDMSKSAIASLPSQLFTSASSIREVKLPDGIKIISDYTFMSCSNLEKVNLSTTIEYIGNYAFYGCSKLDLTLQEFSELREIGQMAFYNSSIRGDLKLPNSLEKIGLSAFYNCKYITSVSLGNKITEIPASAFGSCSGITGDLVIPDNIISIGQTAFSNCSGIKSIVFGNNLKSIGQYCFSSCSGVTSIIFGDKLENIDEMAFYGLNQLTNLLIPESVNSIGRYAFGNCSNLTSVEFKNTNNWYYASSDSEQTGTSISLDNTTNAATYLRNTYANYYWKRNNL